jgi:hypothetical protein
MSIYFDIAANSDWTACCRLLMAAISLEKKLRPSAVPIAIGNTAGSGVRDAELDVG